MSDFESNLKLEANLDTVWSDERIIPTDNGEAYNYRFF